MASSCSLKPTHRNVNRLTFFCQSNSRACGQGKVGATAEGEESRLLGQGLPLVALVFRTRFFFEDQTVDCVFEDRHEERFSVGA